ncbi:putative tetratricopeptide-like helical domain, DYW domain-containing protein [Lupinus albus]|uniref:Putative tetratricopeptide-like helical domain, DYW domain-containing protein n=1 Tax=Lupinus albus TaxID=3870 RepID=A0A6A4QTB8_LUPAL|nr:putative tetratricopeptide-like helical domain, DYW domain-containing protein [Lupinus albus]
MALELKKFLLEGLTTFNHLKHGHCRLLRLRLDQDNYLINIILRYSFHFGNTHYTNLIFNHTQHPNIYLYNTMIRGMVSNHSFHDAIQLYASMRKDGFTPDDFTFPFVLKACARLDHFKLGLNLHCLVVKTGFDCDVFAKTSLVCLYSKCGYLRDARKVFDDIPEKNVVSWTAIICGYIESGGYKEAVDLFRGLLEMGLRPDNFTLVRVLYACTKLGDLKNGEWLDRYISESGFHRNMFLATSLVDMYAKCGSMEDARRVFDAMPDKDIVCWSAMIQGYASNGLPKEALDLFFEMQKENLRPDCYAMVGVLSACARLGALDLGNWAKGLMDTNEFLSNPVMGTALIDLYAKCGSMGQAMEIFKMMKGKDRVVFNAVISGLAMNGHVRAAFGVFGQMGKYGIHPDGNTFVGLLCGCTHAGLVSDGRRYFNSMSDVFNVAPTIEHYGCMVDLLARAGLLVEAQNLIKSMPIKANVIVWGALLGGCRLHRDTQLAEHVLKQLIELEPWNSGHYILLSNIYAASHRWDEAERIRSTVNKKGMQKLPGCSWVEVDGVVHEFLVGDTSHPLSHKIYEKLECLFKDLREAGYNPTTEFVLFDIEEEEKEYFLGCHSEKLAIAFALISNSAKDVIRIVKNLRVCGDCHEAIKLISKVTGREIIIRDNNRFHCFSEGSCSCGDYW